MNKVASSRSYIWAALAIFSALLLLPWGNLALAAPNPCCHHCGSADPGISSGHCCQSGGPGRCATSGQAGMVGCRCSTGSPAFISPLAANAPTQQFSSYCLTLVTVSTKVFPPSIFHPPEPSYLSTLI